MDCYESRTRAQSADVGQHHTVGVAASDAVPPLVVAEAWVEALRVHSPLPHVQPLLLDAVRPQNVLREILVAE